MNIILPSNYINQKPRDSGLLQISIWVSEELVLQKPFNALDDDSRVEDRGEGSIII